MAIANLYLIGEDGVLLRNLPLLFNQQKFNINFIGSKKSVFRGEKNFLEIKVARNLTFIQALLADVQLVKSINGLVIIGTDAEMREIAESDLPLELKLNLLPSKSPNFLDIYDSKIGFERICNLLNVKKPNSRVVKNSADLNSACTELRFPLLAKKDRGSGGIGVAEIKNNRDLRSLKLTPADFPFLLEEKITGEEVGVEAFYRDGRLLGYLYSKSTGSIYHQGPSYICSYQIPDKTDFFNDLESIGSLTNLTGMVNCSFILDSISGNHFIFEFDPRPNAWHFLANELGLDISDLYSNPNYVVQTTDLITTNFVKLDRYIFFLAKTTSISRSILEIIGLSKSQLVLIGGTGKLIYSTFNKFILLFYRLISRKPFYSSPAKFQNLVRNFR